jgi:hypothetical protein
MPPPLRAACQRRSRPRQSPSAAGFSVMRALRTKRARTRTCRALRRVPSPSSRPATANEPAAIDAPDRTRLMPCNTASSSETHCRNLTLAHAPVQRRAGAWGERLPVLSPLVATEAGAGDLFQIRHAEHRAVLVDQEWATDLIYQLLLAGGRLRQKVKASGGWFFGADLRGGSSS